MRGRDNVTMKRKRFAELIVIVLLFTAVLPGVEAEQVVDAHVRSLPEALSFEDVRYLARKEDDGTYVVTVSFCLDADICADDSLLLSAFCADQIQRVRLTEAGEYQFTFRGLPEQPEVKLTVESNVPYMPDIPGNSVAVISITDGNEIPSSVYSETVVTPDRIVDIYKSAGEDIPLPGIIFKIYKVATLAQLEMSDVSFPQKPTQEDIRKYCVSEALVTTLCTDQRGFATFNFTESDRPDGMYMVVELPDVSGEVSEPFFLRIPGISGDGTKKQYTVTVRSERAIGSVPDIAVDISEPYRGDMSFDAFRPHGRVLRVDVPVGLDHARKFTVSDTLAPQLTYIRGSPVVMLFTRDGEERKLQWNTHYYLSEGSLSGDGELKDHFVIALTQQGMSFVMSSLGEGTAKPELRVYYEACIDEDAFTGAYIFSRAKVDYVDRYGKEFYAEAESSGVCTGGIHLHKTDMDGVPLSGAKFRIAQVAEEAGPVAPGAKVEKLTVNGEPLDVVFLSFVPGMDLALPRVDTVTTDENGDASFCGLAHGTYYIVETVASGSFDRLGEPIEARINDMSHRTDDDQDHTILVVTTEPLLPESGNTGTTFFTGAGLSTVCGAVLMLLVNYRRGRL